MEDQGLNTGRGFRTHEYMLAVSDRQQQVTLFLPRQNETSDDKRPGMTTGGKILPFDAVGQHNIAARPLRHGSARGGKWVTAGPLAAARASARSQVRVGERWEVTALDRAGKRCFW